MLDSNFSSPSATAEQRAQRRQRVLKGAAILTGVQSSEIKCAIRNMNKSGAELMVDIDARVPQEFLLYVPLDGIAYRGSAVAQGRPHRRRIHRH